MSANPGRLSPGIENEESFLTVGEVARHLRVSNMTVYRLVKSGQLSAVRVGRGYRVRRSDVERYLARRFMDAG
jgi:excisionase family DNA binding protein